MSFASKVLYTGDGVLKSYNIPMPYISASHLKVFVDEILQLNPMNYTLSGASTVLFVVAPGDESAIEIRRHTSPTAILVDFVNGSNLGETELDTAYLHNYYLGQEYADSFNEVINEALVNVATGVGIIETETDEVIAALVNEMLDSAAAANLQARITDIDANAEAIITLGDGLQVQINTLAQGTAAVIYLDDEEPVPGEAPYPDPIVEGARWYDTDDNNTPYIYQDSAWVSIVDPRIGVAEADIDIMQVQMENTIAAIVNESFVRATGEESFAQTLGLVGSQSGDGSAFILDLNTTHVTPVQSLAERFTSITADWTAADVTAVADAAAAAVIYTDAEILTEQTVRASADTALAASTTTLASRVTVNEGDIDGAEGGVVTNAAQIVTEAATAASATSAVASDVTTLTARVGVNEGDVADNAAQIITEAGVAASATGAVASNLTTLETEVDDNSAAVIIHAASIDGIETEYGVELNSNGYVQGFRIINGGTPGENAFVILADKFALVDPSGDPGETEYIPMQIVGGKVTFTANVDIDGDLVVSGTINGADALSTTVAHRLGSTNIGADAIFSTHIGADQIVSAHILAGEITADHMTITGGLAAITADLGSITAGDITLDTDGYIRGGQTAFNTGDGFFLGYDATEVDYVFSLGDGSSNYLTWDGTDLVVKGDLVVGVYELSDNIILSATTARFNAAPYSGLVTYKTFSVAKDGDVRLTVEWKVDNSFTPDVEQQCQWQVTVNSVQETTWYSAVQTSYATKTVNITGVSAGDIIDINMVAGLENSSEPTTVESWIRNAYIKADVVIAPGGSVILD